MNITLFIFSIIFLQLACLLAAKKAATKLDTQNDYFLAGKNVKFFPLFMTFVATQIGGCTILGAAEEAYQFGWPVLLYPLGACLGLVLLACGIGKKMASFPVSTVAQLFEVVYKSTMLKYTASSLSIISLFFIFVAQVMASKKFMIAIGVDSNTLFLFFWGIVILYTVLGGLKAVIATDVIQAAFFIIVFFISFIYVICTIDSAASMSVVQSIQLQDFQFSGNKLTGWLLMPLMFMVIEQDMGQRCFAAKSPRIISRATAAAAICTMAICIIPLYFGILAKSMGIIPAPGASIFMTVLKETATPALVSLVGCAVLAAILSTADSLLNAITSNLSQDFNFTIFKAKNNVQQSQILTAVIALIGIAISYSFNNVIDLMILSYDLSVSCLFVPVLIALFKRQGNKISATGAVVSGAIGFLLFRFYPIAIPNEIASVMLSLSGYYLGQLWCWKRTPQFHQEACSPPKIV